MLIVVVSSFLTCWAIGSRVQVDARWVALVDRYVITVALPALIIATMTRVETGAPTFVPAALAWAAMATCAAVVLVLSRVMSWERRTTGALLMVAVLGNTSFLGIGVVRALLGQDHAGPAVAYDQLGTFLALATYGSVVAGRFGSAATDVRGIVLRILRFPPFVALVASLALRGVLQDGILIDAADSVGMTVAPVAMGALGLRFRLRVTRPALVPAALGLAVKMVLAPASIIVIAVAAGTTGDAEWSAAVMQGAAPPMVTAGLVAVSAGLDEEVVTFMVGVGTLLSFVSLPLLSMVL